MSLVIFSFAFDSTTKEAVFAGNIEIRQALSILTQLALANAAEIAVIESKKEVKEDANP